MAENRLSKDKAPLNYISVIGFVISLLSIPLFFLCIGQLAGAALSIVGLADARKCGDRGKSLSVVGIVVSTLVIIVTPIVLIYSLRVGLEYSGIDPLTVIKIIAHLI